MKVQKSTFEKAINALIDTHPELSSELETMVKATRSMSRAAQDALLSKQDRIAELEAALAKATEEVDALRRFGSEVVKCWQDLVRKPESWSAEKDLDDAVDNFAKLLGPAAREVSK